MRSILLHVAVGLLFGAAKVSALLGAGLISPLVNGLAAATSSNTYDYIVVGGGTAGFTLASRLSEDGSSVIVLEAGIDESFDLINHELSSTPGGDVIGVGSSDGDLLNDGIDWMFDTVAQKGANNRKVRYARGKCSGGSSARNFMIYQRPTVGSMTTWQTLTGDSSWGFNERLDDFKKSVTFTPPRHELRQEIPSAQYDASVFGSSASSAPISVSYPNTPQNFSKYMQLAANELGTKTVQTANGGSLLGVQYGAATLEADNGHRSSSRKFYAAAQGRSNFKTFFSTYAKRIIFTKTGSANPKAKAVAISTAYGGYGETSIVYANKEIILSAGAFQSPQLLMVSGIGPAKTLSKFGITPVVTNENVGQGMQDHIFFGPSFSVTPATHSFTDLAADPIYLVQQLLNFTANQLGPLTNNVADLQAWERPSDAILAGIGASALSSYPADWPLLEAMSAPGVIGDFSNLLTQNAIAGAGGKRFASILFALVAPLSRGSVTISSKDMAIPPVIDPNWLTDVVDQKLAIYAFKRARAYFATNAMRPILAGAEYLPGATIQSDADILNWIRSNLMTVWHAACTTSMRTKANGGVLDSRLRVYDVDGLRVVDAGSFPSLPPGHPQSTIYMLAERAAVLIKEDNA
ncbi:hypothetical protein CBS101457_001809 [Exobasidium rhododendri]|nr:hypothetical protein CBS101457_001809 [Exobasidium rhododendri]